MTRISSLTAAVLACLLVASAHAESWSKTYAAFKAGWASEDPDHKLAALDRLAKADSARAARVLVGLLATELPEQAPKSMNDEYLRIRREASEALQKGRTEKILPDGRKTYVTSKEALAEYRRITAQATELKRKMDLYANLRAKVLEAAGRLRADKAIDELARVGKRHRDLRARVGALTALGMTGQSRAARHVREMIPHKDVRVATAAIAAAGELRDAKALKALDKALESAFWQVRAAAADALGWIGGPDAVRALIAAFQREEVARLEDDYDRALKYITGVSMSSKGPWKTWLEAMDGQLEAVCKREIARREAAEKAAREKAEAEKKERERIAKLRREGKPIPPKKEPEEKKDEAVEVVGKTSSGFYGIPLRSKRLCFVIDVSGSMSSPASRTVKPVTPLTGGKGATPAPVSGTKLDVCKAELIRAVKRLPKDALFNIVYYHTTVHVYRKDEGLIRATPANIRETLEWIEDTLRPMGGTNIYDALMRTFALPYDDVTDLRNYKHGVDTIYFLTDGMPGAGPITDPKLIVEKVVALNRSRRVVIHTIGVGSVRTDFLEDLAKRNGGKFIHRK